MNFPFGAFRPIFRDEVLLVLWRLVFWGICWWLLTSLVLQLKVQIAPVELGTLYPIKSGQIIFATSRTVRKIGPPKRLAEEVSLFQGNLGWWNIMIWPDYFQDFFNVHPKGRETVRSLKHQQYATSKSETNSSSHDARTCLGKRATVLFFVL